MSGLYTLDRRGEPVPEPDGLKWAQWFERNDRRRIVAQDTVGDVSVSTVFLGIDHGRCPRHSKSVVLWETMIMGGVHDEAQLRSTSREGALQSHCAAIAMVLSTSPPGTEVVPVTWAQLRRHRNRARRRAMMPVMPTQFFRIHRGRLYARTVFPE